MIGPQWIQYKEDDRKSREKYKTLNPAFIDTEILYDSVSRKMIGESLEKSGLLGRKIKMLYGKHLSCVHVGSSVNMYRKKRGVKMMLLDEGQSVEEVQERLNIWNDDFKDFKLKIRNSFDGSWGSLRTSRSNTVV